MCEKETERQRQRDRDRDRLACTCTCISHRMECICTLRPTLTTNSFNPNIQTCIPPPPPPPPTT